MIPTADQTATNDQLITPFNSIYYYNSVVSAMRAVRDNTDVGSFYRLYMGPGMGHCAGGPGPNPFDLQTALEAWVEQKTVPEGVKATHSTNGTVETAPRRRGAPRTPA